MELKFHLFIDDALILKGDGISCAVIYNNLVGLNLDGDELRLYREYMSSNYLGKGNGISDGTRVKFVSVIQGIAMEHTIGSGTPNRVTSDLVAEVKGGFAELGAEYPISIAHKYGDKDPQPWNDSLHPGNPLSKADPKVKIEVRSLGVQHFAVYSVGGPVCEPDPKLFESQSDQGCKAYDDAVLYADSLGLPWHVSGAREIFDPSNCRVWLL